ncbi:NAD(+) synthase [Murimonas intestini]|uniref:Glutamine-dependent NAD(+) synthetase n=1 Tax=Murimonas intestini TaxID=1337051 RepID=A0AB73SZY0_9FIRM|nr:NAD(+) synthase [Murimonas intestini]MCR1843225.1 NAD(+) synthase [Murimonas intestini]MCR1868546.1 NAD(+) synthase [Murimonas intestini]MCR1885115.1 NAD(+) synthase [Murimonas intestini]
MRDGFIRVAAVTPDVRVADCIFNTEQICMRMDEACGHGAKILVFPEMCITGYTCEDLFRQDLLLKEARKSLREIIFHSRGKDALIFVGLPWEQEGKLYNVAAAVSGGSLLGLVPKKCIPMYSEFYEGRYFSPGNEEVIWTEFDGKPVPFGSSQLFACREMEGLKVAAEICEDIWSPKPPSISHAMAGATVIVNLSASNENTGKSIYRESLVTGQSARLVCGYIYTSAGEGESSTDLVFSAHNMIAENGTLLAQSARFKNETVYSDLDIFRLLSERRRMSTFTSAENADYQKNAFHLETEEMKLERFFDPAPFVPGVKEDRDRRCEEILSIQALGLKKRMQHTGCRSIVVGISGGLDSTLALLVMAKACDMLSLPRNTITAVTMPCFGTTDRTYTNACTLTRKLGANLLEVDIKEAVKLHFRDIGHDPDVHDVTYENSQARERTQVLMDVANQLGGMVVGTGDMSELALGWATYNGDHMSMYGVNASVPKTLVRHLVSYYADTCGDGELSRTLEDVLDTPVSPELLPPKDGEIAQKTEDLVGPYELHDFFLYYALRFGYSPSKIYRIAKIAFDGAYSKETILKWLKKFYYRFFSQQFKRSCLPDGPKVGSVAVSPRGDLRMPSDACVRLWIGDLDRITAD